MKKFNKSTTDFSDATSRVASGLGAVIGIITGIVFFEERWAENNEDAFYGVMTLVSIFTGYLLSLSIAGKACTLIFRKISTNQDEDKRKFEEVTFFFLTLILTTLFFVGMTIVTYRMIGIPQIHWFN